MLAQHYFLILFEIRILFNLFFFNQANSSAKLKFHNHFHNTQQDSANKLLIIPRNPSLHEKCWTFKSAGTGIVFTYKYTLRTNMVRHNAASSALHTSSGISMIPCKDCLKFHMAEFGKLMKIKDCLSYG